MPRTTLHLDDAMKVAKAHATRDRPSLGRAVSELVKRAVDRQLLTEDRNGLRVLRLNRRLDKVTRAIAIVDKLREEAP